MDNIARLEHLGRRRAGLRARLGFLLGFSGLLLFSPFPAEAAYQRLLYSIAKSRQDSIHVYDIDAGHRLVRKIPIPHSDWSRGLCANLQTGILYHAYWFDTWPEGKKVQFYRVMALDLHTDKVLWEKTYNPAGNETAAEVDRLDVSLDGKKLYAPSGEGLKFPYWRVLDAGTGDSIGIINIRHRSAHNTIVNLKGDKVYLASNRHKTLYIADTKTDSLIDSITFANNVRPFVFNSDETRIYACLTDLTGFEVGDLRRKKLFHRMVVDRPQDFAIDPDPGYHVRSGSPSHGIALSPDDREIWVVDEPAHAVHVFDVSRMPPRQVASLKTAWENATPGWINMSLDGRYVYPSSGDVIDRKARKIVAHIHSHNEASLELHFKNGKLVKVGKQFSIGRPKGEGKAGKASGAGREEAAPRSEATGQRKGQGG